MLLRLPKAVLGLGYEVARHLLRRPVVGVAAVCRAKDGRYLLIKRGDTGTWCIPGGTVEWGETVLQTLARELEEEAGVADFTLDRTLGVFSRPDRDPRFHAVTIVVFCTVSEPTKKPHNMLEIRDVKLFEPDEIPHPLAMGAGDFLDLSRTSAPFVLE